LSALSTFHPSLFPVAIHELSVPLRVGILGAFPPTLSGLASFSAGLANGFAAQGADVKVVRVCDGTPSESAHVVGELADGPRASVACAELLNQNDTAVIHYEHGIYDANDIVDIIGGLRIPSIVTVHTIPKAPTRQQHSGFEAVAALADQVVVTSAAAALRLCSAYNVDRRKVVTIPHGANVPTEFSGNRCGRPTIVTWGLIGPGKGIERVIDAMPSLRDVPGRPRYVVAGRTHPKVLEDDDEAYRESCVERARRRGVEDSVFFDDRYRNSTMLAALAQSAAVVDLPCDSTDQVTSGVLVDAIANGRPVIATAFPHALELLATGAGLIVDHRDPDALASALRRVLTQPRLAGEMAAESRRLAPEMAWPVVAASYLHLARRLVAQRKATV